MYSDAIKFPPNRSPQWSDFVRATLVKNPDLRPSASALLKHPWCARVRACLCLCLDCVCVCVCVCWGVHAHAASGRSVPS
jgi:hypothetical protein